LSTDVATFSGPRLVVTIAALNRNYKHKNNYLLNFLSFYSIT